MLRGRLISHRFGRRGMLQVIALVSILLSVCTFSSLSAHAQNTSRTDSTNCSASCHSHGQAAATNNPRQEAQDDDKEPTPPIGSWPVVPVDLAVLYLAPVLLFLSRGLFSKEMLLTTQLRI